MYGTGMDAYTLGHYQQVARKMKNYVAASSYNYYSGRDQIAMQPMFYPNRSYGSEFSFNLSSIGQGLRDIFA